MVYLYIGIGGVIGSIARYLCSLGAGAFPYHTLAINIIGSFFLGWFTKYITERKKLPPIFSTAIGTGIVGSFTTLSTFSLDTLTLLQKGEVMHAFAYMAASGLLGPAAAFFGILLGTKLAERGHHYG
ncbi:fluoride efflux transporter CrcB [Niallia circulans]|uniref:fluoride efflux transporter CrcB n=1 Tax=Niallia circulans TaxID=1397 RepID=UPI00163A3E26|nr:fluoride efflux transporter CrcB [Niallia circulans]